MINELQSSMNQSVQDMAISNVKKNLKKQDINFDDVPNEQLNQLVSLEVQSIKEDGKKVGGGVLLGLGISILTGGLF